MENKRSFTTEQLELAAGAASPAALMALAKENSIELTAEQATIFYTLLHPQNGALSDEELDNVVGGCSNDKPDDKPKECKNCHNTDFEAVTMSVTLGAGMPPVDVVTWKCGKCGQYAHLG